jgi:hypothetical protein
MVHNHHPINVIFFIAAIVIGFIIFIVSPLIVITTTIVSADRAPPWNKRTNRRKPMTLNTSLELGREREREHCTVMCTDL